MDWTEKQECVLCDKDGNLLVCSSDGCPISVHKSCMGCEANFDDAGNFHCPYCVYKQITAESSRLREKVMLNKKNLAIFLEENIKDDNHQEPIVEMGDKEEEISLKDILVDENNLVNDDVPNHGVVSEKQQCKTPLPCDETLDIFVTEKTDVNACMIMVIYEPKTNPMDTRGLDSVSYKEDTIKGDQLELDASKGIKVDKQTGNDTSVDEAVQLEDAVVSSSLKKKITRKKRSRLVKSNNYGKRRKEECMKEDLEHAEETLVTLHSGPQLQSKPDSKIGNDDSASLLDHPNGAKNGSLDAKTSGASTTKTNDTCNPDLKDSFKQVSVNDNDRFEAIFFYLVRFHFYYI